MNRATLTAVCAAVLAATGVVAHAQTLPAPLVEAARIPSELREPVRSLAHDLVSGLRANGEGRQAQCGGDFCDASHEDLQKNCEMRWDSAHRHGGGRTSLLGIARVSRE